MRWLIVGIMVGCAGLSAKAADDSIYGTHAVGFQPVQAAGTLNGCALVYRAVQADHAYLNGNPVVIIGNIGIKQYGGNMLLTLKVGVKSLVGNSPTVRPNFSYLQTKSKSTAKVKQQAADGDEGFRLFAYSLFDPTAMALLDEMLESRKVTVAFNRKKNGMDVLVPIDLDVIDAEYPGGDRVVRKRSNETVPSFVACFQTLLAQAQSSLEKKLEKK